MSYSLAMFLAFLIAFLLGSIPFGVIVGKLMFKKDIRQEGSGNIGTTNAIRAMGKGAGVAVFLLDFAKGLLAAFIALQISNTVMDASPYAMQPTVTQVAISLALAGAVAGHVYSPWLGFHGGKGIAVGVGALFVTFGWQGALLELVLFAVLVAATRYVSVGSMAAAIACPIIALVLFFGNWVAIMLCLYTGAIIFFAHRENIERLLAGNENRIGGPKQA